MSNILENNIEQKENDSNPNSSTSDKVKVNYFKLNFRSEIEKELEKQDRERRNIMKI